MCQLSNGKLKQWQNVFLLEYIKQSSLLLGVEYDCFQRGDSYIHTLVAKNHDKENGIFCSSKVCGVSKNLLIAKLKAISEYIERKTCKSINAKSCTGFAAYPFVFRKKKARLKAKEHAYFEMIERYAWPAWWYNRDIKYYLDTTPLADNKDFYNSIQKENKFKSYFKITPLLKNHNNIKVVILYAVTRQGLACAGCASTDEQNAEQNALKELFMHSIGIYQYNTLKINAVSNYDKRVIWIMSQEEKLKERLKHNGNKSIEIPRPTFHDIPVSADYNDCFVVQRCTLEGYSKEFIDDNEKEMYV